VNGPLLELVYRYRLRLAKGFESFLKLLVEKG
jgi:hypothetical protein